MLNRLTISDAYRAQQQELHRNPDYGVASLAYASTVKALMEQFGTKSVSDYGAGKCNLRRGLHELGKTDFEYFPMIRRSRTMVSPSPPIWCAASMFLSTSKPSFSTQCFLT